MASSDGCYGMALLDFIGFQVLKYTPDAVEGKFVVSSNSSQPFGVLHGGISAYVSEAVASMGAVMASNWQRIAGIELNISHLRSADVGQGVYVVGKPLLTGKRLQVWEVKFTSRKENTGNSENTSASTNWEPYVVAVSKVTVLIGLPGASKISHLRELALSRL